MGKLAPVVEIDLDRPRHLRLDLNAMVEYERATGKSMGDPGLGATMTDMRCLLWVCLLADDPTLTVEQVGAMIHAGNITEVNAALSGLMRASFPEGTADANADPKAPSL